MGLFGRFAEALAFLPALGLCRLGESGLVGALGGLEQLGADFLAGDVAILCAEMQQIPMLAVTEPPDAAADEDQEDKDNCEGAEDLVLPEVERLAQRGQFITEALDLKVQVGVAGGVVVKVAVVSPFVAVSELQSAALSPVAGRIRVRRIIRKGKVEAVQRRVACARLTSENKPGLFLLLAGAEELELGIRDSTIVSVNRGRLRAVALADHLDEALAGVDLVAENLAQVAGLCAEDFLNDRRVAQPCKDGRDPAACLPKLRRNAGDKDGRLVHGPLFPRYSILFPLCGTGGHEMFPVSMHFPGRLACLPFVNQRTLRNQMKPDPCAASNKPIG